jgi:ABC-2 type transport system ATP-binding protein
MQLEAQNLTKLFGSVRAVDDLNFKFEGPGLIGYLGPNGAGKTTTLKLFANLLRPTSGKALIDGIEVKEDYKVATEKVSALIETPEPYPYQTIAEFLTFIARIRGMGEGAIAQRIDKLRVELSLEDLRKKTGNLSKGHKSYSCCNISSEC